MSAIERSRARAVADLAAGTIIATVDIAAPAERVFRALSTSEIVDWWGAEGLYRTTKWTGDLRVGGRWRADGMGADGKPFAVEGEFIEIDPPRTLAHTWKPDWDPGEPTTVRYRLEPIDGGTRVTIRHDGFDSPASCAGHARGWERVLGWLQAHAAARRSAPPSYFLIRLLAPRPTFMIDMTDDERRVMQEHVAYWTGLLADGVAVAFGPVADPKGGWGVGIVELDDAAALKTIEAGDPVIRSDRGFRYEILPMPIAIVRPH